MATGMIIDGALGSEAIDSSGEVLSVEGADISDVDKGSCLLNWEHQPGEKGASTIVGIVLAAKKIYSRSDCETDRQRMYWDEIKLPYIYGLCRLYDGAGHEEAKRIAAIIRDHAANNEPIVCRFSVEGATLTKEDNRLVSSIVRRVAVTVKPCNRTALSGLIEDPNAPEGFDKKHVKEKVRDLLDFSDTEKSENYDPMFQRLGKSVPVLINPMVDESLAKAYTAGMGGGAPSTLTGGAALQREDLGNRKKKMIDVIKTYKAEKFNRVDFRSFAKTHLPEASDEFLDHFADMAEDYHVKRSLIKKEAAPAEPATPSAEKPAKQPKAPKVKAEKAPKPVDEENVGSVNISHGTIRGVACMPNNIKAVHFDENTGILHTQKGSFPLYNPDKGFQMKEDASATTPHYEDGVLKVAPGTDTSGFHNAPNPNFREIYNSDPIEDFHSGKVMPNWTRVHALTKAGKLPEEVIMHAAIFSMLSPNTPVRPHELMYAHMNDTWEDLGIDPRDPHFKKAKRHWLGKDQGTNYPRLAREYFQAHKDVHLGNESKEKGRKAGELMSFMLGENKFKNISKYHKLHSVLRDLVAKHGTNARAATADLMRMKTEETRWKTRRAAFKGKVKKLAATQLGLKNNHDDFVNAGVEKARAAGLMGKKGESRTGDKDVKNKILAEAKKLGLTNDLNDHAEKLTQDKIGDYKGVEIPGLAPKTGRFTFTMLGGGNSFVPDTHIIRHLFGMDNKKDGDTLAYLKSVVWNSNNHHVLEGIDRWYAKNHPAAQLMQNHEKWGEHFKDDKEMANFPAFWRHWCSIAEDERQRGMPNASANEFSTHEPFWMGIHKFVKAETELDDKFIAKMVALHTQYEKDHGEIPAQMMYFTHIVPHLLEFGHHRQTHDDIADLAKSITSMERLDIELRKHTADLQIAQFADPKVPTVHGVHYKVDGKEHRAGRFLLHDGHLHHLEDHHGLLERLLPEGKLTLKTISALHGLKMSPHLRIDLEDIPSAEKQAAKPTPEPVKKPRPPSVFEYQRAGHDKPHTLEVTGGKHLLDGEELSHPEVQTILNNYKSGAATIRYKSSGATNLSKIEEMGNLFAILAKAEAMKPHELVRYIREAEAKGHMPQGAGDAATKHFFEDPMTPGIGNKLAFTEHMKDNPGGQTGTYIQMDGNDFSKINNAFGHAAGDGAIKTFGEHARKAMDEAVGQENGKLWRNGGDEFVAKVPSPEHAAKFSRLLSEKLKTVAPIGGVHNLSMSFGFGNDPHTADKALYEAKKQKLVDPPKTTGLWSKISKVIGMGGQKRKYKVGQTPNLAHSLVPGQEGPLPVHDAGAHAVHDTLHGMQLPAPPKPAKKPTQSAAA